MLCAWENTEPALPDPLPSSARRRNPVRPAVNLIQPNNPDTNMTGEIDTSNPDRKPLDKFLGYEAVEVAANAIITAIIEGEPDLGHTGAIRQAVQLLYNIGKKPGKAKGYKQLHELLETLEQYHKTS